MTFACANDIFSIVLRTLVNDQAVWIQPDSRGGAGFFDFKISALC